MFRLSLELAEASYKLVKEVLKVVEGEEVVITVDTESDLRVAEATAQAAKVVGAKPLVAFYPTPPSVGKAADSFIPRNSLTALLTSCDVWVEYNKGWLLYSTPYEKAMERGSVRYMCLVGMDTEMLIRNVGRVNVPLLLEFQRKLAEITGKLRTMRVTTPAGTDLVFENDLSRPVLTEGDVNGPGEYMLFGQVDWAPIEESINGTLVFDGSVWPPRELGLLKEPIELEVKDGKVVDIKGGEEASTFERWLRGFNDERMLNIAHISYGCNPGAKLTGNILEDERVWGVVEFGLGSQSSTFKGKLGLAPSHTDGVCLRPTVEGDGVKILKDGEYVHPELESIAKKLRLNL